MAYSLVWFEPKKVSCKAAREQERKGLVITMGTSTSDFSLTIGDSRFQIGSGQISPTDGGDIANKFKVLSFCNKPNSLVESVKCSLSLLEKNSISVEIETI